MKLTTAYRLELERWRLTAEQHGLLIAFIYCLDLRMRGIDFERHWNALCGEDHEQHEGRDYGNIES